MKQSDRKQILSEISILIGMSPFYIGRNAATGDIGFRASKDEKYILAVGTAFRFYHKDEILIANLDMFQPTVEMEEREDFDWDTYNWDVQGLNLYDQWAKAFEKEHGDKLKVSGVSVSNFGDLKIEFENGMVLEVLINTSGGECWRFFERNSDHHLVVCPEGIER